MINRKANTKPVRIHPELERIILNVKMKNMMKGREIRTPRVTLAIARQYKKYPNLLKELEDADLK